MIHPLSAVMEDGVADDIEVSAAVKQALMQEGKLRQFTFEVETRKGDVKLWGQVETQAQREQAAMITAATSGVHSVNNQLEVK